MQLILTELSNTFQVRRLHEEDVEEIYTLCKANKTYYKYFKTEPTHENITEDLYAAPPGKKSEDKYFLGFFHHDHTLVAVLDLIVGYPNPHTAFIGLFMTAVSEQRQGTGTKIIQDVLKQLAHQGMTCVRLGCISGNTEAASFWKHNGFHPTGEQTQTAEYRIDLMEKVL